MKDIFDHTILCKSCDKAMKPGLISKNGFNLRALGCKECNTKIIHPSDKSEYEEFIRLKEKDYEVKMRMVGNSYAVSIPREIVSFMEEHQKIIDNMVRLSFEDAGKLSLAFNTPREDYADQGRFIWFSASEVTVVENGKTTYHEQKFRDSKTRNETKQLLNMEKRNKNNGAC